MKKLVILLTILLSVSSVSFSQQFVKQHLKYSFKSYEGLLAKIDTVNFYSSYQFYFTPPKKMKDDNVAYPRGKYTFSSEKDSLKHKIFRIEKTELTQDDILGTYALFTLIDTLTNRKLFYVYRADKDYEHNILTQPTKIVIDKETLSDNIFRKHDEIDNEIHLSAPISNDMNLHKYIKNGKSTYFLDLSTEGSTYAKGQSVTVLFTDGTKWSRTTDITARLSDNWVYSTFIPLTSADIQLFKTKSIKKYRLYIFDEDPHPYDSEEFRNYVDLISVSK